MPPENLDPEHHDSGEAERDAERLRVGSRASCACMTSGSDLISQKSLGASSACPNVSVRSSDIRTLWQRTVAQRRKRFSL
jgi:hypothetical protein